METEITTTEQLLLTETEIADMDRLETKIQDGLNTFMEVGAALAEINERRLYRQTHATFADYCRQRWDLGKSRAYQLINAAGTARQLSTIVDVPQPENEAQMRPLNQLAPERRAEAWSKAVAAAGEESVTGEQVQAVVDEMLGKVGRFENDKYYPVDADNRRIFNLRLETAYGDPRFINMNCVRGLDLNQNRRYDAFGVAEVPEVHPQDVAVVMPGLDGRSGVTYPVDHTNRIIYDAPTRGHRPLNTYAGCEWLVDWDLLRQWESVRRCLGEYQVKPAKTISADWLATSAFKPGMWAKCSECANGWQKDRAAAPYEKWKPIEPGIWACHNGHRVEDKALDFNAIAPKGPTPEELEAQRQQEEAEKRNEAISDILDNVGELSDLLADIRERLDLVAEALQAAQVAAYRKESWRRDELTDEAVQVAREWVAAALDDESLLEDEAWGSVEAEPDGDESEDDSDEDEDTDE